MHARTIVRTLAHTNAVVLAFASCGLLATLSSDRAVLLLLGLLRQSETSSCKRERSRLPPVAMVPRRCSQCSSIAGLDGHRALGIEAIKYMRASSRLMSTTERGREGKEEVCEWLL